MHTVNTNFQDQSPALSAETVALLATGIVPRDWQVIALETGRADPDIEEYMRRFDRNPSCLRPRDTRRSRAGTVAVVRRF